MASHLRKGAEHHRRAAEQLDRWADGPIEVPEQVASLLRTDDPAWALAGKAPESDRVH